MTSVIFIVVDSLRQDHVSFYGWEGCPVETPNIDALARESVAFENMYPEALPTIPVRTQWMTGQRTLPFRPWQPLTPEDRTVADILSEEGYLTALFTDCYHFFKPGYNLHRSFRVWRWIRGQEYDPYRSGPLRRFKLEDFVKDSYTEEWKRLVETCLVNLESIRRTEDYYCARLVREAIGWLEENRGRKPVLLWVDSFDPHEPWFPPPEFDRYTDPNWTGKRLILPPGGPASAHFSEDEIRYIRGLYAGEVAYVDHYIGQLLEALKEYGYYDDSIIVLSADHGHPLADHGKFLKGGDRMYSELLKVPFMIRFPGGEYGGRKLDALAQFHDVLPTILDAIGLGKDTEAMHGKSLMPLIRGEEEFVRDAIITGYYGAPDRCIRDKTWSYIRRPEGEPDELYNLVEDPRERKNLIDEYPEEAARLASKFGSLYAVRGKEIKGIQGKYEVEGSAGA
ncbi:MAG: sulfatase [Candidatus Latescibacterota bacterium]|nr:MAG: sulfatase [Candidatus Latescibacterota bacterium]